MNTNDDQRPDLLGSVTGYSQQRWTAERPAAVGRWWLEDNHGFKIKVQVIADPFNNTGRLWLQSTRGGYWPVDSDIFDGWRWAGPLPEPLDAPDAETGHSDPNSATPRGLAEDSARTQRLDTPTPALRTSPLTDSIADRMRENRDRRTKEGKRPADQSQRRGEATV